MIGSGAYGNVYIAKKKSTGKLYAIKRLCKRKLTQEGKQYQVFRERQALIMLDHPNIVKMYWTFDVSIPLLNTPCRTKSIFILYLTWQTMVSYSTS
jgi:serine/threonine protein kinase